MDQTQTLPAGGVLVGYFDDEARAERALRDLQNAGFTSAHIGVAHRGVRRAAGTPGAETSSAKSSAEEIWDRVRTWFHRGPEHASSERVAEAREQADVENSEATAYTQDDLEGSLAGLSIPENRVRYFSRRISSSAARSMAPASPAG